MFKTDQLKLYFKNHPITSTILLINLVMTIIVLIDQNFSIETLVKYGALNPILVTQFNEYYRLITVMFLHVSILHFAMNSMA